MRAPEPERSARATLGRLAEPGDVRLHAFVRREGAEAALAAIIDGTAPLQTLAAYRARLAGDSGETEAAAERAVLRGARFVVPGDLEWPSQLTDLDLAAEAAHPASSAPLGLWVRGRESLRIAAVRSVAVVGSRAASAYGSRVASDLGAGLSERGYATVSGGAYGVDAAAHRGALAVGGMTVCVIASGVDVPYPRGHHSLFERIADEGVLVSEQPPGSHPTKGRFLIRNRLIAALTRGTVVVEAAFRSGALNTTLWARRMRRPVLGLPGPVTSTLSAGVHRELMEGRAELVTNAGDVVAAVGSMGESLAEAELEIARLHAERQAARRPGDQLDAVARRVLDAVPAGRPADRQRLARDSGLSVALVHQRLVQLSLLGLVQEDAGGWRLPGSGAGAPPNG